MINLVSEEILNLINGFFVFAIRHQNSVENIFDVLDCPSKRIGTPLDTQYDIFYSVN